MRAFLDDLRALVQTDDALAAVAERLSSYLRTFERELYNEALAQSGRLFALERDRRRGTLSADQYDARRAAIRVALLDFIDEVERVSKRLPLPFARTPIEPKWPAASAFEVIVGDNRLQSIAWLRRGLEAARSVCRITTAQHVGSGFLIEGGWIVTNHHVLPDATTAAASVAELNLEEDLSGALLKPSVYKLDASTWKASEELDCALVKVAPPAAGVPDITSWGALRWSLSPHPPAPGDYVTIVQHPSGGPKRIALSENQVVNVYEHRLQYTTDTMPGSSGSPVFDDAWNVVAVHHAGGNLVSNPKGDLRYINEGILAGHVKAALGLS